MKRSLSPALEPDVSLTSPDADIEYLRRQLATNKRQATAAGARLNKKPTPSIAADTVGTKSKKSSGTSTAAPPETTIRNHDLCDACGDVGQFICCDACPNAFHFTCVDPPMSVDDVDDMEEKWYCNECTQNRKKNKTIAVTKDSGLGLFQQLVDNVGTKNPKSFRLPNDIINFFEGVSSDKLGKYVDSSQVKRVKYRHGEMERPDYHPLKRNGHYITCYYCRKTALTKQMISCDYCPLYWHLDCLNPPMPAPPNPAKRWRCPVHIENFIKQPRRQKNKTPTIIEDKTPSCAYHNYLEHIKINSDNDNDSQQKKLAVSAAVLFPTTPKEHLITTNIDNKVYRLPQESFRLDFDSHAKNIIKQRRELMNAKTNNTICKRQNRKYSLPSTLLSTSSGSEISTPPLYASPVSTSSPAIDKSILTHQPHFNSVTKAPHRSTHEQKEEVDKWLKTMAIFKTNATEFKPTTTTATTNTETPATTNSKKSVMTENRLLTLTKLSTTAACNNSSTSISPPSSPIPVKQQFEPSDRKLRAVNIDKFKRYKKFEHLLGQKSEQELISMFNTLL